MKTREENKLTINYLGPNQTTNNRRYSRSIMISHLMILLPCLFFVNQLVKCSQLIELDHRSQHIHNDLRFPKMIHNDHRDIISAVNDNKLASSSSSTEANNYSAGQNSNQPIAQTNVTDLRLTADFRAAKLRWIYKLNNNNDNNNQGTTNRATTTTSSRQQVEPASFDVRFCELTTWRAEIKCRHREMFVPTTTTATDNSVISKQQTRPKMHDAAGQQLTILRHDSDAIEYEAQIFDLRALTNYTFQVRVLKFNNQDTDPHHLDYKNGSSPNLLLLLNNNQPQLSRPSKAARRLSVEQHQQQQPVMTNELVGRIETKPFRAEATKCLADVSEVVITTGKYFGGRISVEGSVDKRCQLIGNKTSEQTSYTFKIDHELCHSKVVDGNRIETMVLVHENKEILTHNTARFLVLCNFLQKSFTLRASISLPKINGVFNSNNHQRQAVITPLNGKPTNPIAPIASKEQPVLLGSMPGIFRAKPLDHSNTNGTSSLTSSSAAAAASSNHSSSIMNELDIPSSLEKNAIRKMMESSNDLRQRQPKGLNQRTSPSSTSTAARSRSMELLQAQESSILVAPEPVQIQSKLLYVERQPQLANLIASKISSSNDDNNNNNRTYHQLASDNQAHEHHQQLQSRLMTPLVDDRANKEVSGEEQESIILTNNHRIVGNYKQTSTLKLDSNSSLSAQHSIDSEGIKYSGAKVSEYSIGELLPQSTDHPSPWNVLSTSSLTTAMRQEENSDNLRVENELRTTPTPTTTSTTTTSTTVSPRRGERTSRMHNIAAVDSTTNDQVVGVNNDDHGTAATTRTDRRMGDMRQMVELPTMNADGDLSVAETSNNNDDNNESSSTIHIQRPSFNQSSSSSSYRSSSSSSSNGSSIVQEDHNGANLPTSSQVNNSTTNEDKENIPPLLSPPPAPPAANLAQNLTNYLLKWSLKTLTNLAKKSLDSLANRGSDSTDSMNESFLVTESTSGGIPPPPPASTPTPTLAANANAFDEIDPHHSHPHPYPHHNHHHHQTVRVSRPAPIQQQAAAERQLVSPLTPMATTTTHHRTTITTTLRPNLASSSWSGTKPAEISSSDGFDTHSRPQHQRVQQQHSPNTSTTLRSSTSTSLSSQTTPIPTIIATTTTSTSTSTANSNGAQQIKKHATYHHQQQQNHRSSGNYSKSLDFDRAEAGNSGQLHRAKQSQAGQAGQQGGGKATPIIAEQTRDSLARTNESGGHMRFTDKSSSSSENHSSSISWLLVGCLFLMTLIIGVFTIFCLVSSYPKSSSSPSTLSTLGIHTGTGSSNSTSNCGSCSSVTHLQPTLQTAPHIASAISIPKSSVSANISPSQLIFSGTIVANHHHRENDGQIMNLPSTCYSSDKYDYNRFQNYPQDVSSASSSSSSASTSGSLGSRDRSSSSVSAGSMSIDGLIPNNKQTTATTKTKTKTTTQAATAHLRLPTDTTTATTAVADSITNTIISNTCRSPTNYNGNNRSALSSSANVSYDINDDSDDENNCTNSELLLAEHVLITGSSSRSANESYA